MALTSAFKSAGTVSDGTYEDGILFHTLPSAAFILNADLDIIAANEHAGDMFGEESLNLDCSLLNLISRWQKDLVKEAIIGTRSKPGRVQANLNSDFSQGGRIELRISRLPDHCFLVLLEKCEDVPGKCRNECRKVRILEAQYQHNPAGILLVNEKMEMLSFNKEFLRMWSIPESVQQKKDDNESLQTVLSQLKSPEKFLEKVQALYNKHEESSTDEVELLDGRIFYRHTYPVHHERTYLGRVWYFLDITPLKQAQRAVQVQQKFQEAVLENINDGIVACDSKGKLTLLNRATREIHGHELFDVSRGKWSSFCNLFHPDEKTPIQQHEFPIFKALHDKPVKNEELVVLNNKRGARYLRANGRAMFDSDGEKLGAVISLHDITDLRMIKKELEHTAHHDCLTGLPNRIMFHKLLEQCLHQAKRINHLVGILFLDLDNFKQINDTFGHDVGDHLLRCLSECLRQCLRDSDLICRWGGDEFVIALPGLKSEKESIGIAQKICEAVRTKMKEYNPIYTVTISMGISVYPRHGRIADKLIRKADLAMYSTKKDGKNGFFYFDAD